MVRAGRLGVCRGVQCGVGRRGQVAGHVAGQVRSDHDLSVGSQSGVSDRTRSHSAAGHHIVPAAVIDSR